MYLEDNESDQYLLRRTLRLIELSVRSTDVKTDLFYDGVRFFVNKFAGNFRNSSDSFTNLYHSTKYSF